MRALEPLLGGHLGLAGHAAFIHTLGDVHLYRNHLDQARLQLSRAPRPLPQLRLDPSVRSLDDFGPEHIELLDYDQHPTIRAEVAV